MKGLEGARIGIPRNAITGRVDAEVEAAFDAAVQTMRDAGATIVDNANYSAWADYLQSGPNNAKIVLGADFVSDLPEMYLSRLEGNPQNVQSLEEVVAYTKTDPREAYPDRDVALMDAALALGFNNTSPQFWAAYQAQLHLGGPGGVVGALDRDNLDALILPSVVSSTIPALVGTPVITVPLGFYPASAQVVNSVRGLILTAPGVPVCQACQRRERTDPRHSLVSLFKVALGARRS